VDRPELEFPVACQIGVNCEIQYYMDRDPGPGAKDYMCRGISLNELSTLNIRLPNLEAFRTGVDVLAAAAGRVSAIRDGMADVSIADTGEAAIKGRECGNGVVIDHPGGWQTQYCHLQLHSLRVRVGHDVTAGAVIGQVGLSGLTEYAHLGFKTVRNGKAVDPFAPDGSETCAASAPLWSPAAMSQLGYKRGAIINVGFSGVEIAAHDIREGKIPPPDPESDGLIAYVTAINLEARDVLELTVVGPGGTVFARQVWVAREPKAEAHLWTGRTHPAKGWPPGLYRATCALKRTGRVVLQRTFETTI
jgi:hypothetical protein